LLDTAEWRHLVGDQPAVDAHHARLDARRVPPDARGVAAVEIRGADDVVAAVKLRSQMPSLRAIERGGTIASDIGFAYASARAATAEGQSDRATTSASERKNVGEACGSGTVWRCGEEERAR
jgi:hypothetical protein